LLVPSVAGIAHVILAVEDDGVPPLTSYRRIIFEIHRPQDGPARERRAVADARPAPGPL
jgi:Cellulose-binding protein Sde0182, C-terminal domain